jgi:hydrogenase/urease accessory protein HupE
VIRRLFIALLFVVTSFAFGHDPKLSGIGISSQDGLVTVAVQAHASSVSKLHPSEDLSNRLRVQLGGIKFRPQDVKCRIDSDQGVVYWTATTRSGLEPVVIETRLFPEDPESRTIVSLSLMGKDPIETILDRAHPRFEYTKLDQRTDWGIAQQFFSLGITHIFGGADHILFILGLILAGGGLKSLLKSVTAFTLAHSITLTVAATGLWVPASKVIEPLIALSIVVIALENLRSQKSAKDWRPLIAFGFGLIHGFGFAGGVTEAGLPPASMFWALGPFNLGVETAQASIVLVAWPILVWLAKLRPVLSRQVVLVGSAGISVAGALWFFERVGLSPAVFFGHLGN